MAKAAGSFSLLFVVILLVVGTSHSTRRRCYRRSRCVRGLFMNDRTWTSMNTNNGVIFNKLFKLKNYRTMVKFNETCGALNLIRSPEGVRMEDCSAGDNVTVVSSPSVRKRSVCESCCITEMSFSVPQTVTEFPTGDEFDVKHFDTAFQVANLGECANLGAACGFGGQCDQAYRIDWVMVNGSSGDTFVPVSIPSHCTCIYS